ncbi:AmpG family muropeptide MFS transporter [Nevskia soli]|uniref:AmpG family muropeptide MFS transporter n=1 Tax=Nevskia soli TaxID=418856 RepID=UPI0004A6E307
MQGWLDNLKQFTRPGLRSMLYLGFSAGLPFLLVFSTLTAWLTQAGVKRATIGSFAWVGLTYTLKIVWAPVVDRVHLPLLGQLGRRRSWMMLGQCGIALGLTQIALRDPATELATVALLAVFVAFCSATQDIALDAFRIETPPLDHQDAKAAAYQFGYRVALIVAGAGALVLASTYGWRAAYLCMAALGLVGPITTWLISEPAVAIDRRTLAQEQRVIDFLERTAHWPESARSVAGWFIGAVVCPFVDFFNRYPVRHALLILLFIGFYRLTDYTMGAMANNFYLSLGFGLTQIAGVSKVYGVIMTMVGIAAAGALMARHGILRTLLVGALVIFFANLFYAWMAWAQPGMSGLVAAISLDNFGIGIAGTAFVAYLSGLTSAAYTATQYALFGSLWPLPGKFIAGFSGNVVDAIGYPGFFVYSAVLGIPGVALLFWLMRQPPAPAPIRT